MADVHLKKTRFRLGNTKPSLKTPGRDGSCLNGSFAAIFYELKFSGQRYDLKKLNCQLAWNVVNSINRAVYDILCQVCLSLTHTRGCVA